MNARRWRSVAVLAAMTAVLGAFASGAQARSDAGGATEAAAAFKVGIVYSRTGLLSAYGAQYIQGLRYGLAYATQGKLAVNGRKIELTIVDDGTDPTKAVAAGRDLIGRGYKILAGSVSSGVALQMAPLAEQNKVLFISGPAATDAVTGINKYTFRSGRQTYQDVKTAATFLKGIGRKVTVFAQDSAFGAGNYTAVNSIIGSQGHTVGRMLVPLSAQDFTPFAQQVRQANPDLLFVAWAGTTAPAMWRALEQQGAFGVSNKITTGLAERATWSTFGDTAAKIDFLSHYVHTAPKNKVNDFLVNSMRKRSQVPDLFTPDGFVAGQMIVRALQGGGDNVDRMIAALEGWNFVGPKGQQSIRASDHAMIQPMFQVKLVKQANGKWQPRVISRIKGQFVAPPGPR
jgi:branched-chain amino acid transport system substrate-binding protein